MGIHKELSELIEAQVISQETADKIDAFYRQKSNKSPNRLVIAFGILGALLVGFGIILIIAHNWDHLSIISKTIIAFLPLTISQVLCGYVLFRKFDSSAWREGVSVLLFCAIGACISMISQIYQIPGSMSSFLFTWMLLALPIVYIMRSSMVSLLYLIGITYYTGEVNYWNHSNSEDYWYWILLLSALPHYYLLLKKYPESNFTLFHNWAVPLSITFALGCVANTHEEFMYLAYFSLFSVFCLMGNTTFFDKYKKVQNGYKVVGVLGTLSLLLTLSFSWFWEKLRTVEYNLNDLLVSPEFLFSLAWIFAGIYFLIRIIQRHNTKSIIPFGIIFLIFIPVYAIGMSSPISILLINILVFVVGLMTILKGFRSTDLGVLNLGLLIIAALMVCRFFDSDLSFVIRGILFVTVGAGFFVANYWILKKRNLNED